MKKIYLILLVVVIILSSALAALSVAMSTTTIGYLIIIEQVSITKVTIPDNNTIQVLVQNSHQTPTFIATGFINGAATTFSTSVPLPKNSTTAISFVQPINATFTMTTGNSYTIKLITTHGTTIVSAPITYNPLTSHQNLGSNGADTI